MTDCTTRCVHDHDVAEELEVLRLRVDLAETDERYTRVCAALTQAERRVRELEGALAATPSVRDQTSAEIGDGTAVTAPVVDLGGAPSTSPAPVQGPDEAGTSPRPTRAAIAIKGEARAWADIGPRPSDASSDDYQRGYLDGYRAHQDDVVAVGHSPEAPVEFVPAFYEAEPTFDHRSTGAGGGDEGGQHSDLDHYRALPARILGLGVHPTEAAAAIAWLVEHLEAARELVPRSDKGISKDTRPGPQQRGDAMRATGEKPDSAEARERREGGQQQAVRVESCPDDRAHEQHAGAPARGFRPDDGGAAGPYYCVPCKDEGCSECDAPDVNDDHSAAFAGTRSANPKTSEGVDALGGERASHEPPLSLADRGSEESAPHGVWSSAVVRPDPETIARAVERMSPEERARFAACAPAAPSWVSGVATFHPADVERREANHAEPGRGLGRDGLPIALHPPLDDEPGRCEGAETLRHKAVMLRASADHYAAGSWPGRNAGAVEYEVRQRETEAALLERAADILERAQRPETEIPPPDPIAILRGYNRVLTVADPTGELETYTITMRELADWLEAIVAEASRRGVPEKGDPK